MIVKTEAVVLKTMKYGDTSKIVTLLTKEFGLLTAIAKGARGTKSKFGSALEPTSYVSAVLYKKDTRELQLISDCTLIRHFGTIREHLERLSAALSVVELIRLTSHEEKNDTLFALTLNILEELNTEANSPQEYYFWFQFRLAELLGFRFQLEHCFLCEKPLPLDGQAGIIPVLELQRGGMACNDCVAMAKNTIRISLETLAQLRVLLHNESAHIQTLTLTENAGQEIDTLLRNYLRLHIEGLQPLRSERVFAKVLS